MTADKRRRLQLYKEKLKDRGMTQQTQQTQQAGGDGSTSEDDETKPLIFSKHFMAEFDGGDWFIYRLIDFLNPVLKDGPASCYNSSDQPSIEQLMNALDGEYEAVAAREMTKTK